MNYLILIFGCLSVTLGNECFDNCDYAIANYVSNVCNIKEMYASISPVNKKCAQECIESERANLADAGCFEERQDYAYCDYLFHDCAYRCDFWSHCVSSGWDNAASPVQQSCYDACPNDEESGCVETNCGSQWMACEVDPACYQAVESFVLGENAVCNYDQTNALTFKQCIEDSDHTCGDDGNCVELFENLRGCVVENGCHTESGNNSNNNNPSLVNKVQRKKRMSNEERKKRAMRTVYSETVNTAMQNRRRRPVNAGQYQQNNPMNNAFFRERTMQN